MNLDITCPKCKSELNEVNVSIEGTKQKIKSYQCPNCDYFAFNTKISKKIIKDLIK